MTMGQRIAERRKLLGFSQEALGERMGVSRQAISKWEADGAIPEIDKLIALSRLFSVSVGWLLGTEEEPAEAQDALEARQQGLTEEQLRMVEEIVKRYQPPRPKNRVFLAVTALGLCCAMIALIIALLSWQNANRQFPNYDSQLQNLSHDNSYIQGQLSDLRGQLDELAVGEKLLNEYETQLWMSPHDAEALNVAFTAVPKTWQEGCTAWLSLRQNGVETRKVECTWDGVAFNAAIKLTEFTSGYESFFVLCWADGTQEQQNVSDYTLENLPDGTEVVIDVQGASWELSGLDHVLHIRTMSFVAMLPELLLKGENEIFWTSMELMLRNNDQDEQNVDLMACGQDLFVSHGSYSESEVPVGALWLECGNLEFQLPEVEAGQQVSLVFAGTYGGQRIEWEWIVLEMTQSGSYTFVKP